MPNFTFSLERYTSYASVNSTEIEPSPFSGTFVKSSSGKIVILPTLGSSVTSVA